MMEDLLNGNDLYDSIEGDDAKSNDMSYVNWKKLKKKTLGAIVSGWTSVYTTMLPKKQIPTLSG